MKKYSIFSKLIGAITLCICAISASCANELTFVAFGDQPYGPISTLDTLIQKINEDKASAFSIHVGDIKAGSARCDTEYFIKIKDAFNRAEQALIYTPGDNEWTDCHRGNNGGYVPTERLNALREIFFSDNNSLGKNKIPLELQSRVQPQYTSYVENRRWSKNGVLFITINQPGSNNNLDANIPGAIDEYKARNKANIAWLKNSFESGKHSEAIVIAMQSDTNIVIDEAYGFTDFLKTVSSLSKKFKRPILVIQGDSHEYLVDQALLDEKDRPLPNVLRLVVPGAKKIEAVEVSVDTNQKDLLKVFTFKKISGK